MADEGFDQAEAHRIGLLLGPIYFVQRVLPKDLHELLSHPCLAFPERRRDAQRSDKEIAGVVVRPQHGLVPKLIEREGN